jgi:hypothetical protein
MPDVAQYLYFRHPNLPDNDPIVVPLTPGRDPQPVIDAYADHGWLTIPAPAPVVDEPAAPSKRRATKPPADTTSTGAAEPPLDSKE